MNSCLKDSNEKVLKDFILDIDCLEPLNEWTNKFNLFDVLKITRTEIRHSNVLSWLLNPNENHGMGDKVLKGVIQFIAKSINVTSDTFHLLLMNLYSFEVRREWKNIDILVISQKEKFIICIENKIDSNEHSNQLRRYYDLLEEIYPKYKKYFIYLNPEGNESSDTENWLSMSYLDILDIIETTYKNTTIANLESKYLIENYIDTIRRDIVGDEKLAQICAEIYSKHQKALDLIFENIPDKASEVANVFKEWCEKKTEEGKLEVVIDKCNKSYTRFKTKIMSEILPDAEECNSGWKTKNYYFYEIHNINGNEFCLQLVCSSKEIPDNLRDICEQINKLHPANTQKKEWQWRIHFITNKEKIGDEISKDIIFEQLDSMFKKACAFENKLKEELNKKI
jgi:hypothetical protein